jgi:phage baseplate assembly protein V
MITALNKLLNPIRARISNMIARSVVQLVDDSTKMQIMQLGILADETRDGVERFQNYGFTSVPLPGAEAVVLFVGGRRDHGLAVAVDDRRHRLSDLQSGEVAVYHHLGGSIVLKNDGTITIDGATGVIINGGVTPVAKIGSSVTGTAGPFPLAGTVASGSPLVLVP